MTQTIPAARQHSFVATLPIPRAGSPPEVAMAYIYLMLNGYATGQILPIDGGGLVV